MEAAVALRRAGGRGARSAGRVRRGGDGGRWRCGGSVRTRFCTCGAGRAGGRKSLQPTLFRLEETPARYESVQQFLADSPWDPELLVRGCAERVAPRDRRCWRGSSTTPGSSRTGKHSPGVKRQYSGTLGKIGNCQITVSVHAVGAAGDAAAGLAAVSAGGVVRGLPRRRKAKIPDEVVFETKPQLARGLCEQAAGWEMPRGADPRRLGLRRRQPPSAPTCTSRGSSTCVAVRAETSVYGPETTFAVPERNGTRGRPRTVARPDRKPESARALARAAARRARGRRSPCRTTPAGEEVAEPVRVRPRRRHRPGPQPASAAARGVADHRVARRTPRRRATTGSPTSPRTSRASGSPGSPGCAGRSSSTTASSKASSGSTTTKAAATSASTTTARSSPARTPSSRSNGSTQKPRGRPDTAAGGAAPAARPALLGRPLPNLPTTRRPRPAHALRQT